jgi:hypothetical protein
MTKSSIIIILFTLNLLNIGCAQNTSHSINDERYKEYKKHFDKRFIDHFPPKIPTSLDRSTIFSDRDEKKNDFALILYEYGVSEQEINITLSKVKDKTIARYKTSDSCLLMVNRFETKETLENYQLPNIGGSTVLNKPCYKNKYPIPNFINYDENVSDKALGLDNSFTIYVLESERVDSWIKEFGMGPAAQMPDAWKNGYSKGIAISEEKKIIIYWTVIW